MKLVIVDDEHLARERLRGLLDEFPGWELVGEAGDGRAALDLIDREQPDLVLLDIRMPGMDGLQVARALAQAEVSPAIIFTTAFSEHALSAFDTLASSFLLKPIKREKLREALLKARRPTRTQLESFAKATQNHEDKRQYIVATTRDGQIRIPINDVVYFYADQKYTTVYHLHGEVLIEESLRHLEDDLRPHFLRIHRKALVNRDYIVGLERADEQSALLTMRHSDVKLSVSRRRLAEVRRELFKEPKA